MPREFKRADRIAQVIRKALAPLVSELGQEYGYGILSITEVSVSPDLKNATIFVSCLTPSIDHAGLLKVLKNESGRMRQYLAGHANLRFSPIVDVRYDDTIETGMRMGDLLRALNKRNADDEADGEVERSS